jgi:tetratricopeptide (TPR) repeat protein
MMRYFVPLFAFVMLARMGFAQDDLTMMRLIQHMFENSPRLRADRERNLERRPVCDENLGAAVNSAGTDAHAWMTIGRCALKQQNQKMADTAFRKVVALAPSAEAYALLAMALVNQSKLEEAPEVLRRGAELDDNEDQLFRTWGAYYRARGDLQRAADSYSRAIAILYPGGLGLFEYDDDYTTLGDIYHELGDHQNAARAYEDACLAYLCPNEQTTLNYGRELLALKRADDLKLLIDSVPTAQQHAADQLREEAKQAVR